MIQIAVFLLYGVPVSPYPDIVLAVSSAVHADLDVILAEQHLACVQTSLIRVLYLWCSPHSDTVLLQFMAVVGRQGVTGLLSHDERLYTLNIHLLIIGIRRVVKILNTILRYLIFMVLLIIKTDSIIKNLFILILSHFLSKYLSFKSIYNPTKFAKN